MKIKEWLLDKEKEEGEGSTLVKDVANHGCSGGVPGLIYYNETVKFYDDHEEEIWEMLEDHADNEGLKLVDKMAHVCKVRCARSRTAWCGGRLRLEPRSCWTGRQLDRNYSIHFNFPVVQVSCVYDPSHCTVVFHVLESRSRLASPRARLPLN